MLQLELTHCFSLKYYKNPDKTKRDVQSLIQQYRGLQPKVETFGKQSLVLLNLSSLSLFCLLDQFLMMVLQNNYFVWEALSQFITKVQSTFLVIY